ncbi:MAG TPA: hypothetical protein VLG66_15760 [Alphaproteobacteria bacterium]|nr:hypothetical protein [Alphaproteobacteria bacterium]
MTMRPVPDRAEVSVDFPDKTYMGAFGRNAKFEAMCRPNDVVLKLRQTGAERRDVELHIHHMLFVDVLDDLAQSARTPGTVDPEHRREFAAACRRLADALDEGTPGA